MPLLCRGGASAPRRGRLPLRSHRSEVECGRGDGAVSRDVAPGNAIIASILAAEFGGLLPPGGFPSGRSRQHALLDPAGRARRWARWSGLQRAHRRILWPEARRRCGPRQRLAEWASSSVTVSVMRGQCSAISRSRQILRARKSLISRCRGIDAALPAARFTKMECRAPSLSSRQSCASRWRTSSLRFTP